jgi:hypothetical protein
MFIFGYLHWGFPVLFISCEANSKVYLAKTVRTIPNFLFYVFLCCSIYCLFCVVLSIVCVYMCTVLPPPGGYPIAVNKCIIYHIIYNTIYHIIISYIITYHISHQIVSYHVISYRIIYHIIYRIYRIISIYHIYLSYIVSYHIISDNISYIISCHIPYISYHNKGKNWFQPHTPFRPSQQNHVHLPLLNSGTKKRLRYKKYLFGEICPFGSPRPPPTQYCPYGPTDKIKFLL